MACTWLRSTSERGTSCSRTCASPSKNAGQRSWGTGRAGRDASICSIASCSAPAPGRAAQHLPALPPAISRYDFMIHAMDVTPIDRQRMLVGHLPRRLSLRAALAAVLHG
jgi:hypothetical protein